MPEQFEKRLEHGPPVVTDGGMGVLVSSAVPRLRCPEEANVRAPESVVSLHASFIRAGAELIETNTFGANRHKLRAQYLEDEVRAINEAAVKLAREAREIAGRDVYIGGSIGPLVELEELTAAIDAVRSVSRLPIVAMLTFDEDAETLGGVSARDAVARLSSYELAAIGANHGAGLHAALAALEATGARSRRSRTSALRASPAGVSSTRMRRPSTSPSSRRRRGRSAHA